MDSSHLVETITAHLGGEQVLTRIGARGFFSDGGRVTFRLAHSNPKGVHSVVISAQPHGFFGMECYGKSRAALCGHPWSDRQTKSFQRVSQPSSAG